MNRGISVTTWSLCTELYFLISTSLYACLKLFIFAVSQGSWIRHQFYTVVYPLLGMKLYFRNYRTMIKWRAVCKLSAVRLGNNSPFELSSQSLGIAATWGEKTCTGWPFSFAAFPTECFYSVFVTYMSWLYISGQFTEGHLITQRWKVLICLAPIFL